MMASMHNFSFSSLHVWCSQPEYLVRVWSQVRISLNTLLEATGAFATLWMKQVKVHRRRLAETTSLITSFCWIHGLLSLLYPSQEKILRWELQFLPAPESGRQGRHHTLRQQLLGLAAVCPWIWVRAMRCCSNLTPEGFVPGQPLNLHSKR